MSSNYSDAQREQVRKLAMLGVRQPDIAQVMDISMSTLTRHFARELKEGLVAATERVGSTLYEQAMAGNTTAMIFWMKTRGGWRERDRDDRNGAVIVNVTGALNATTERPDRDRDSDDD